MSEQEERELFRKIVDPARDTAAVNTARLAWLRENELDSNTEFAALPLSARMEILRRAHEAVQETK